MDFSTCNASCTALALSRPRRFRCSIALKAGSRQGGRQTTGSTNSMHTSPSCGKTGGNLAATLLRAARSETSESGCGRNEGGLGTGRCRRRGWKHWTPAFLAGAGRRVRILFKDPARWHMPCHAIDTRSTTRFMASKQLRRFYQSAGQCLGENRKEALGRITQVPPEASIYAVPRAPGSLPSHRKGR